MVTICTVQWSLYVPYSGHYMYRTVVTICTTSLTFSNSTFCPHIVFVCFVWIWGQTAIISLYSINWLVFITDVDCVYCAVRTVILNTIQFVISLFEDPTMAQTVIRHPFPAGSRVRFQVSLRGIFVVGKVTLAQVSPSTVIPRLTKIIRSGITFVCQNLR